MPESIQQVMIDEGGFENPLKLNSPVLINGEQLYELGWDADNLTVDLYCEAADRASSKPGANLMETDYNLHFWMGCALVIAANQSISFDDLKIGLKGQDIFRVVALGRFFTARAAASADES